MAVEEYQRLLHDYARLDYETIVLPKAPVTERADIVLERLAAEAG
ncbi:hypothetical protein X971_2375 [Agrobacterium tumefaciens LBA4213 (Ach5)]|nr:hypothetical protein X971_2375 [Agrobacterium tumefaciens LBA4213 (Ach5)]